MVQDLYLNKYTTTTTRIGCNNIISAANKTELAFQESITKMASVFTIDRDNKTTTVCGYHDNWRQHCSIHSQQPELVFLEIRIVKIEENRGFAARISSGADIAAITKENNDLVLVTDKFDPMAITDKNDPLLVTDKNIWSAGTNFFRGIQHSKRYFGG